MKNIDLLNGQYGIHDAVSFVDHHSGIPQIVIQTDQASAKISLLGANLISWIPVGESEVIWLSDAASFAEGKSIRGGIPICWPWFGAHEKRDDFPAHGFTRTSLWQLKSIEQLNSGEIKLDFKTEPQENTQDMWPTAELRYQFVIGRTLEAELTTMNTGNLPITISQALHTYFRVAEISKIKLYGLEQRKYLDKLDDFKKKKQTGPIEVNSEVDRIYLDTDDTCIIEDKELKRQIIISKQGSLSTVVWNPWQYKAKEMGDLGEQGYRQMLCVESANAADDAVQINPGHSHKLAVNYQIKA